jgi:hypothetical protein
MVREQIKKVPCPVFRAKDDQLHLGSVRRLSSRFETRTREQRPIVRARVEAIQCSVFGKAKHNPICVVEAGIQKVGAGLSPQTLQTTGLRVSKKQVLQHHQQVDARERNKTHLTLLLSTICKTMGNILYLWILFDQVCQYC